MSYMGTHDLMSVPRLGSAKPLVYFVFLGELLLDLFLVKGLFGNFGFLPLLAGFPNIEQERHTLHQVLSEHQILE